MVNSPLYPYQERALDELLAGVLLLALPPGAGKTLVALTLAQRLRAGVVLVIGPAIAESVWVSEISRWWPGAGFIPLRALRAGKPLPPRPVVVFTSYDLLVASAEARRTAVELGAIDLAILDEAHAAKSPDAKRTRLLYGPRLEGNGLLIRARRKVLLTGTPMPNGAHEIFTHLRALAPERIGETTYAAWVARTCYTREMLLNGRRVQQIVGTRHDAIPYLRQALAGFMHKPPVAEIERDLPPLRSRLIRLPAKLIDAGAIAEAERSPEAELLRAAIARGDLRSVEGHLARVRRLLGLAKVAGVAAWAEGALDEGEPKAVVWAWHLEVIEQLRKRLDRYHPVVITGASSAEQRAAAVQTFQGDPGCRVFIGQLAAAGQAITLHAARRAIFAEESWTPSTNYQAAKRCHRVGQHHPVLIDVLIAGNSLDEAVAKVLARKSATIAAIEAA